MDADIRLNVYRTDDIPVVKVAGDLDEFTCSKLREALRNLLSAGENRIVVNVSGVDYMDSAGLGTLVGGLRRVLETDGGFALSGPNPQIEKVLSVTGMNKILRLHGGEDAAIDSLKIA